MAMSKDLDMQSLQCLWGESYRDNQEVNQLNRSCHTKEDQMWRYRLGVITI